MVTFTDILNRKSSSIEPPKALPVGTYLALVEGNWQQNNSARTGALGFQFTFRLIQPQDDVSQDELTKLPGGINGKTVKNTIYVSDGNEFFLKQFLVDHLAIEEGEKNIGEMLAEVNGKQVMVNIKHTVSTQDPNNPRTIHIVGSTARV